MKPLSRETLIEAGKCCGNKCKNCAYYPIHTKDSVIIFEIPCEIKCLTACDIDDMKNGTCMCYLDTITN